MSVPSAELSAPALGAPRAPRVAALRLPAGNRFYLGLALLALAVSALSLLVPSTPSYDPWSWLIWGREIVHLSLKTTGGPTWKPLPVVFTTVFALFGKAQPDLWLVVARAGALAAAVMVFRIAFRLTSWAGAALGAPVIRGSAISGAARSVDRPSDGSLGGVGAPPWLRYAPAALAGAIAAVSLVFSGGYISDNVLGYSEGLMTALVLIAVERHLDGHPRQAFAFGFLAALDRPEIWLFWGVYGLWLFRRDPGARRLVIVLFALIPVLWFLPEYWGSGHFFRGVSRAHNPRSNSPAYKPCPFCSELVDHAWPTMLLRIKVMAALLAGGAAWLLRAARRRRAPLLSVDRGVRLAGGAAALGLVWFVIIAILTQAGFSGNDRYLVLGAALVDIAGGVGWGCVALWLAGPGRRLAERAGARLSEVSAQGASVTLALLGFVVLPNFVGSNLISIQRTHRALIFQATLRKDMNAIVRGFGGRRAMLACGTIMTEGFQVPLVAWTLDVHSLQILAPPGPRQAITPPWPNVILQARDTRHAALLPSFATIHQWEAEGAHYRVVRQTRTIRVFADCRK